VRRQLQFLILLLPLLSPAPASADWLTTPFAGFKFGGAICPCPLVAGDLVDPEEATGLRKFTFGASFGLLTDGLLGLEADFAYIPGYFDRAGRTGVAGSSALTLTGDVMLAVPAAVSRDGLRPYLLAGAGLVRWTRTTDPFRTFDVATNQFALAFGGGAIGRLNNRTSMRFELRRIVGRDDVELGYGLSFWRATVGVAIHH
jgi:opacity protein-like surface antigen